MYAVVDQSYQKIYLVSDTAVTKTQLDVYHKNVLIGYFNTAGTGDFTKPLVFASTATSLGTKYIFTIEPADIGMTTYFDDYLYHFILSNAGSSPEDLFGTIVDRGIMCCMTKALEASIAECGGCDAVTSTDAQLAKINAMHAYLIGAKAAIRMKSVTTAMCALAVIEANCDDCGCYG